MDAIYKNNKHGRRRVLITKFLRFSCFHLLGWGVGVEYSSVHISHVGMCDPAKTCLTLRKRVVSLIVNNDLQD